MDQKKFIVVLDGARGAGKTTTGTLLKEKLDNTAFVGLDLIRECMSDAKATDEHNRIAFEAIFSMAESFLLHGMNVVIDSGMTEERIQRLQKIGERTNSHVFLYHLTAPKEILWDRIVRRGNKRGRSPDPDRFEYTHKVQQEKDFSQFISQDTVTLSPSEVVDNILMNVRQI